MRRVSKGKAPSRRGSRAEAAAPPAHAPAATPTIVAIGASAGGLEAIEQFLRGVPQASGLAFVIVQHLDPSHEGAMPELLRRATPMPVAQVKDGTRVEADHVYVIPPNADLSILRGVLHLSEPAAPRGQRLPIDGFFRSLAEDQRSASVAVILSGMGTDGSLGLKAVKERGGVVLVQEPSSAKFDSMPRSAINTRLVDVVAPAHELPARLVALVRGEPSLPPAAVPEPEREDASALDKIVFLLRARLGRDFSQYKRSTVARRVARRMALQHLTRHAAYLRYLQESPQEQELLFSELLIGVTSFFRDPAAWDALRDDAIPGLLADRPGGGQLRAWIPGCSTGEEAYSLAITFREALERVRPRVSCSLQIFATDLDPHAIARARQGIYPANITSDVSPARLRRFFAKEHDDAFRVNKEIRESVVLAQQDVIRDPPFTRMDLVLCRNLLIYLEPDLQRRLIALFHHSLRPGGILFLGKSENISGLTSCFGPIDAKLRIYRRKETASRPEPAGVSSFFGPVPVAEAPEPAAKPTLSLQAAADELVLRQFGPAAALVNDRGDILYTNGRTGKYLEPAAGRANWNVFAMAREGLRHAVSGALQRAIRQGRAVTVRGLGVGTNGGTEAVDLTVKPLQDPGPLRGTCLVVFREAAPPPAASAGGRRGRRRGRLPPARVAELERETRRLHDELRKARDDTQTTQEELRSANEELQSANEELQSTNEELTTSKEEMQSMNEELQTVNAELQAKVDQLSRTSNDMKNLLDSTEIATLFLDGGLCVRRFTEQATRLLRLIPTDVGRAITDVTTDLVFPELADSVAQVLKTLVPLEREVATTDGRWFASRILPYRTLDDVIDGVVITFSNISAAKRLEAELRQSRERFGALLETLPQGLAVTDGLGRVIPRERLLESITGARSDDLAAWRVVTTTGAWPVR